MLLFLHSLVIYVANFILVLSLRPVLRRFLSKDVYPYCAEVLGSFLMVANVHENGNVYGQYGMGLYSACLFALIMVYAGVADSLTNPINVFDQWWNKKMSTADAILKIMAQVIGALLAARYMKWLWKTIALSEYQVSRANFLSLTCDSANKVTLLEAIAVELLAASTLRIFASFGIGGPSFQKYINAAATILVILAGLEWTGSMINPALATAMTYNCQDHPFYEHVLVYWVAPFTGSILSDFIEDFIHGPEYRNKSQTVTEQPQSVKTARKKKTKKSKARKSSWDPAGASQGKNGTGVSPKRRRRKDTNNNSKRTTNVGV